MLSKTKNSISLILLLLSAIQVTAQFSIGEYMSTPFQESEIAGLEKQLEYINSNSFRSPLFRELQLRIGTKDIVSSLSDIRVRLGFLNPLEQRANKQYENTRTEYLKIKYSYEINCLFANRYKQLIKHHYLTRYSQLLSSEIMQLSVAFEQMQRNTTNIKEWIKTDERILEKQLEQKNINTSIELQEYIFTEVNNFHDTVNWDNFNFITVNKMREVIFSNKIFTPEVLKLAQQSLEVEKAEYKIDKAKAYSDIGFLQANYDIDNDNSLNENIGLQLGVTIPLFNPDKPKLQRKKLSLIKEEYKVNRISQETSLENVTLDKVFVNYIRNYNQVSNRLTEIELLGENISYENTEEFTALITYISNLKILQFELYNNCLNTYIEILALSGRLTTSPYLNYISEDVSPLLK